MFLWFRRALLRTKSLVLTLLINSHLSKDQRMVSDQKQMLVYDIYIFLSDVLTCF